MSSEHTSKVRHLVFALFVGMPAVVFWLTISVLFLGFMTLLNEDSENCNIARVPLHGIVTTTGGGVTQLLDLGALASADDFVENIQMAEDDDMIEAILVDIDSPGGTPVAGDEMMSALLATQKPVVAVIRETGASAAYWVASGADHIIASPVSNVGSIGVTMSYLETASSTDTEGSRWIDLSSGAYKDAGHPERPLRDEEVAHFKTQVDKVYEYMIDRIAGARKVFTRDEVVALADGRTYAGTEALHLKLVDALGGFDEARTWIAGQLGISPESAVFCAPAGGGLSDILGA